MSWWPFKRQKPLDKPSRKTQDLSPDALAKSAERQDLFALVELFLVRRIETELALEEKRAEVKLKSAEAEAQTKLKLAELAEQRPQLHAAKMPERNRVAPRDAKGRRSAKNSAKGRAVCADPASPHLTVDEIRLHHAAGQSNGSVPTSR